MPAAPRGGQDQLHGRPVLPGLLGHLGQVADRQLLTVQRQVVERPPGSAGYVVRELHLGLDPLGRGVGLEDRGHLGISRGLAGQLLRLLQAPLGGLELEARGAAPRRDVAAPAERVRGVGGQVTGHLGQVVVAGPAEAHRPGQRRGGRPGQVAQEVQPRLHGGVLVVKRPDGVPAALGLRPQPRGLLPERIDAVAVVNLDVQQGQAGPAGRDPDRRGIHVGRQGADHHRLPSRRHAHRAAALHPGAVPEDGHRRDRRVEHRRCLLSTFSHPFLRTAAFTIILPHERYCSLRLTQSPFARRRARVICGAVASV